MLRVGLIPGGATATVRGRLLALGALPADAAGPWSPDHAGVALVPLEDVPHLVVEAVPAAAVADVRADVRILGWDGDRELVAMVDGVWRERLVPFEENLRLGRRAPRRRTPLLVGPDAGWASDAARLVARLHAAVGPLALRTDHIGSTSVPGLRAKDLIDIQVTVRSLDDARAAADAARAAGVVPVAGDWSGEDRAGVEHPEAVAVDADPGRATNVNFRPVTAPVWRDALLFRDWLSSEADERASYEAMKCRLATADEVDVDRYGRDKMPWIRAGLARAEHWAAATGWAP